MGKRTKNYAPERRVFTTAAAAAACTIECTRSVLCMFGIYVNRGSLTQIYDVDSFWKIRSDLYTKRSVAHSHTQPTQTDNPNEWFSLALVNTYATQNTSDSSQLKLHNFDCKFNIITLSERGMIGIRQSEIATKKRRNGTESVCERRLCENWRRKAAKRKKNA